MEVILFLYFIMIVLFLISICFDLYILFRDRNKPYISKYTKKIGTLYINEKNEWDIKR